MKLPKLPKVTLQDLTIPGILLLGIIIVYLYGLSLRTHPDEYTIPFDTVIAQPDDITCGPTSATMILHHYGHKGVTVDETKALTKTVWFTYRTKDIGMTSPDYLPIAMRKLGVPSQMKYGSIDTLKHDVSEGRPVIALVRSSETTWHYIVVRGFTQEKMLIADPGGGELYEMPLEKFVGCWSWNTDMDGTVCKDDYLCTLLRAAEVYPYTYIAPDKAP